MEHVPYVLVGLTGLTSFLSALGMLSFLLIIPALCGLQTYDVRNREVIMNIQRKIKVSSHKSEDGKALGLALGWFYIAYMTIKIEYGEEHRNCYICTTKKIFDELCSSTETQTTDGVISKTQNKTLTIYERSGNFQWCVWNKRQIVLKNATPLPTQHCAMQTIRTLYKQKSGGVILLHGKPGSGKSMIPLLLAQELKAHYTKDYKPYEPNCKLGNLWREAGPSDDELIIVVLEEFDIPLVQIHNNTIPSHKTLTIECRDKIGWNGIFDDINNGMYPYMLVFLTTNKTPEFLQALDSSYIRPGRVDLTLKIE